MFRRTLDLGQNRNQLKYSHVFLISTTIKKKVEILKLVLQTFLEKLFAKSEYQLQIQ